MRSARVIRWRGAIAVIVLSHGCGDSATPLPQSTMPFDPSGSWEAQVQGLVSGSQVDAPMVITLSVLSPNTATNDFVDLTGTWQWGGLGGIVDGFWHPFRDVTAETSGCPALFQFCALGLNLLQPPNSCPDLSDPFGNTIDLGGWFNGSATMVGASLEGTYWEGAGNEPCPGPVLISLDTEATFARN